jgi:two-component system, OmpR family, sensor histidine kinase AdeS
MMGFMPFRSVWRKMRSYRWPLTRQIAFAFAALMVANGLIISVALEYWSERLVNEAIGSMSPEAQRTWQMLQTTDRQPTQEAMQNFTREFAPVQEQLNDDANSALYILIALAGMVTLGFGYLQLGRLGRGLGSVASAAQRITDGDLTARALPASFRSREEDQLTRDFNVMAASLQRAERELSESAASIAHELRTPLTVLRGRLHGIADGVFALEPAEIQGLLYQVEGLGRLVDDLQTLSLVYSDRMILDFDATDLAEEIRRVLATFTPDLEAAGLEPMLLLQAALLVADGARIRQVIAAVLSNVVRYAPLSGTLHISTAADNGEVVLEIADNGPGIVAGSEERAFDRFWRGDVSRNRHSGGSGLGLSVVRAIVEAHGGTTSISNRAEGGALFVMRLPTNPTDCARHNLHSDRTAAPSGPSNS